jgi:chromosome segregation ATPase
MANFKFFNIGKANAEISAAEEALNPAMEKAGIRTVNVDGKDVAQHEAPLGQRISALLAANPPGARLQDASELLASNDVISKRCEKAESDLAIAQTSVATLTRDNATLQDKLTAAHASIQTLTAESADCTNRLQAAVNQFTANAKVIAEYNTELSRICLANGCLELMGADGKPLAADAPLETKLAAADAISIGDKLKAYQGAVNSALTKVGVEASKLPGASGTAAKVTLSQASILNQYNAITDPTEKASFRVKNMSALFAAAKSLNP